MEGYINKMAAAIAVNIFFMGTPFMGSEVQGPRSKVQVSEDSDVEL